MSVTLTTLPNSFYPQFISEVIGRVVSIPVTYNFFVFVRDLRAFPSRTWRHTFRSDIPDAEPVAELANVPDGDITDNFSEISVQTVGRSAIVSWEAQRGGTVDPNELASTVVQVTDAHRRKFDSLLLTDVVPGLTNEVGSDVTPMTYAQHVANKLALTNQVEESTPPGSVMRCAMAKGAYNNMVNDMITTEASIFAATFGSMDAAMGVNSAGMVAKPIAGVATFVTDRVPVNGAGRSNVYCYVGTERGSCFGMAVKWGIDAGIRDTEQQLANRVVGSASIGFGILRQDYGIEAISAA